MTAWKVFEVDEAMIPEFQSKKMMKKIRAIYEAGYTDYDGLDTYRVMPTRHLPIDALDPFLFLNHHGPQTYAPGNEGLPFGPHPHKGFETVTFIVEGDLVHQDSTGFNSNIKAGGVQWMTAGRGIIHSETSSEEFRNEGGPVEILQLWVNLPSHLKQVPPAYVGLQKDQIPDIVDKDGKVVIHLVSGRLADHKGPVDTLTGIVSGLIDFSEGGYFRTEVPESRTVLFYVIRGSLTVNGESAATHDLVEFTHEGSTIEITAREKALVLFAHGEPTHEPIAAHGPFVMNTQEEIRQAFVEYQQGKFGVWSH